VIVVRLPVTAKAKRARSAPLACRHTKEYPLFSSVGVEAEETENPLTGWDGSRPSYASEMPQRKDDEVNNVDDIDAEGIGRRGQK
jgi:hypothetical protein